MVILNREKMARKRASSSWSLSCGEGKSSNSSSSSSSSSSSAGFVGTWLQLAAVGLALFTTGAAASMQPDKYYKFRQMSANMRGRFELVWAKLQGKDTQIYREMNLCPPKPLQVFEYGPSRPAWVRDPKKYKYQYVCVVATTGSVEEGIWHRRKAPRNWDHQPPFHVRIVRPSPAGLLDLMMAKKKVKLATKEVTITRTDKRTGDVIKKTKQMTALERCPNGEMPEHVAEMLQAETEGRSWKDERPTKGRWGRSNFEQAEEDGVLELLSGAGIETPEEMEDVTKVVDKQSGKKFDLRRYLNMGEYQVGYDAFADIDSRAAEAQARKEARIAAAEAKRQAAAAKRQNY